MNKIIALNWKNTQTAESVPTLLKTAENIVNMYLDYTWMIFPGDEFISTINTTIPLGTQNIAH
jgi:triosephosphate isomerase